MIAGTSSQSNTQSSNAGRKSTELAGPVPILRAPELGLRAPKLGDEVQRLTAVWEIGNGIGNEFLVAMTDPHHRATVQQRSYLRHAPPEERAVPARSALRWVPLVARHAVDAISCDDAVTGYHDGVVGPGGELAARMGVVGVDSYESVPEVEMVEPHPFDERLEEHLQERAPIGRELRPGVTGRNAPGFGHIPRP